MLTGQTMKVALACLMFGASAFGLAACGASVSKQPTAKVASVSLLLNTPPSGINAAVYEAQKLGYYTKQHLDVTILSGTSSATTVEAVAANKATVGFAIPSNALEAAAQGSKVVSIGTAFGKNGQGVFVPDSSGITSLKQLTHVTIGVLGSSFEAILNDLLTSLGVNPDTNKYVVFLTPAAMIQSYNSGSTGAVVTQIPFGAPLIDPVRPSRGLLESSYGIQGGSYSFVTSPQTLKQEPSVLERFLTATYEGFASANRSPASAAAAEASYVPGLEVSAARQQYQQYMAYECSAAMAGHTLAYQAPSDWTSMAVSLAAVGAIPATLNVGSVYTNQFASSGAAVECK
jgi:NitT/TauT family transport system substrate-binding protein